MYLCGSLLQGHSTPPPPDCVPLEASLTLLDKVEVVFHALNSDRFGLETCVCVCVCVCVFVSVFMYVCVCSVLVQSQLSGKYIGSGHGGRLKPSTAVYVTIYVTTTISDGIFCSWWPAIAGGQYYIDTHSKCMQDNLSKYCREEVIKHFDMHTSLLFSHIPHISHAHTHRHMQRYSRLSMLLVG